MKAAGVEIKRSKQLAFKIPNGKRFVRCDSLSDDKGCGRLSKSAFVHANEYSVAQRDNKKTVVLGAVYCHAKVKCQKPNRGFDIKSKPPFSF